MSVTKAVLSDGRVYAWPLSAKDEFELLSSLKQYTLYVANRLTQDASNISVQDLAQDGWLAMWQATRSWNGTGQLDGWMKAKMQWAMLQKVQRRKPQEVLFDTGVSESDQEDSIMVKLAASEDIDVLLMSYHEGEILQALNALTPKQRQYVVRRFWLGQCGRELREALGTKYIDSLWHQKKHGARYKLARALSHLVEV